MANSKYEYTRSFEQPDSLLPNTWIVMRIDGRNFHRLSNFYHFYKPNDGRALDLMNASAKRVLDVTPELVMAYGVSDEFSFVFHKSTTLFERRASKLLSTIVSTFTAYYIHLWPTYFNTQPISPPHIPTFDGRVVQYPSIRNLRDYLSWRQADCHINNLYNTTFWALVDKGGMSTFEAESALKGTLAADKNEILFSRFGINYNNEADKYRKGSVVYREFELAPPKSSQPQLQQPAPNPSAHVVDSEDEILDPPKEDLNLSKSQQEKRRKARAKATVVVEHVDIIKDEFWDRRPWILKGDLGKASSSEQ